MKKSAVSATVIKRLPRYHRYLTDLLDQNIHKISSKELAEKMSVTASQIRQDLNCFGGFGQQGYGYNVDYLLKEIKNILGVDRNYKAILIGLGNLGHAIANHVKFEKRGITLIGVFDVDENIVGNKIKDLIVRHTDSLEEFCEEYKPTIAVLTLPKAATKEAAEKLASYGIKGFWNFANTELSLPNKEVSVENVHLGDSLMSLCFSLSEKEEI